TYRTAAEQKCPAPQGKPSCAPSPRLLTQRSRRQTPVSLCGIFPKEAKSHRQTAQKNPRNKGEITFLSRQRENPYIQKACYQPFPTVTHVVCTTPH
ncbi:hypothetical protein LEMLEM_LOCUS5269, partial [Lemmus lemmus]